MIARQRGGVFLASDAREAGFSPPMIRYRLSTGRWEAVRRGAYLDPIASAGTDRPRLEIAAALAVVASDAAASDQSAARLLGLDAGPRDAPMIWLTRAATCRNGRHDLPGIIERSAALPPSDVVIVDKLRCTSAARTILDLARHLSFADAVAYADLALHTNAVSSAGLDAMLRSQQGWPGSLRAQRVLEFASPLSESPLESRSRVFFDHHGLPAPELQVEICVHGELVGRLDFLWRAARTIGEADGRLKYADPQALWAEKRREDRLRAEGFQFVRWGWSDLFNSPGALLARLEAALLRGSR
jgi:hypothetical protein